jgi:hypothetical protein
MWYGPRACLVLSCLCKARVSGMHKWRHRLALYLYCELCYAEPCPLVLVLV